MSKTPVKIAVTGALSNVNRYLFNQLASGALLGKDQPIHLSILDRMLRRDQVKGLIMELKDTASETIQEITVTDSSEHAFGDAKYAFLVAAKPRGIGMERSELLVDNGEIFTKQGKALNDFASKDVKVLVVGNPANSNALIAQHNAPDLDPRQFHALMRLDHNRAVSQLAEKTGAHVSDIKNLIIWGNHSTTQYPDLHHTTIKDEPALNIVDQDWYQNSFIPQVIRRGAVIIQKRGFSSDFSTAAAAIDHMRDWVLGTDGATVSMAVPSDGSYGIEPGVIFGYPCVCENGDYKIVQGLPINEFSQDRLNITNKELRAERDKVTDLLGRCTI